jgi:TRAP transporter TAXI family solute receptor
MKNAFRRSIACITVAAALAASSAAQAQQPVNLNIASFIQGSGWSVYAVNLAEVLRQSLPPGSKVDSPPIAGAVGNVRLVSEGKADLAFGMALVGNWAHKGIVAFKEPVPNLRALAGGWDLYYLFAVAAGRDVGPAFDKFLLKDKPATRISLLPRGGVGPLGAQQILALMGAGEDAVKQRGGNYDYTSFEAVKGRFGSRTVDLFMNVANPGHPSFTEIAQNNQVTFLQPPEPILEEMSKRYGWTTQVMPKGTFPTQENDLRLPGTTTNLFASTRMSDDVAYTVVKVICEKTDRLQAAHKALAKFDCANGVWKEEVNGLPLHAGAAKYYRERGWLK